MHFLTATTLLALPLSTLAQSGYGASPASAAMPVAESSMVMSATEPAASSSMSGGMMTVQTVKVSNKDGTLVFTPNNVVAAPGSMVQFQFYPKNHSVVQAAFAAPCVPVNNVMPTMQGFFSGFMPVSGTETAVFTLPINDTKPIWFYCSQGKHCQAGMVGAINAPMNDTSKTVAAFAAAAKLAPQNLSPGQASANSTLSGGASGTTSGGVVQQTTNGASGSGFAGAKEIVMSLGLAGAVAAVMLTL